MFTPYDGMKGIENMLRRLLMVWGMFACATSELWVIYHPACGHCEEFLAQVVPRYPDAHYASCAIMPNIKLLNVSFPEHQKELTRIKIPIFTTPYFLLVENTQHAVDVRAHWKGYKSVAGFYHELNAACAPRA